MKTYILNYNGNSEELTGNTVQDAVDKFTCLVMAGGENVFGLDVLVSVHDDDTACGLVGYWNGDEFTDTRTFTIGQGASTPFFLKGENIMFVEMYYLYTLMDTTGKFITLKSSDSVQSVMKDYVDYLFISRVPCGYDTVYSD